MRIAVFQTLILINLTSKIATTTINCFFDNITIPVGTFNNIQGYGCDIQSFISEEPKSQIKFNGNHNVDKSDSDVTVLKYQINDEYQLPHFNSSFCEIFMNTEIIFLSHLEILTVGENSLQNCQKLRKLYFYGNGIREIPENLFPKNSNLTVLNIDFNFLSELPDNLLKNQKLLEDLSLTNNQLSSFSSRFFDSLTNLNSLGLGSNQISTLNPKWFKKLENLVTLGLERNEITDIPDNIFSPIRYLVELNLSNNKIQSLTSGSFHGLIRLRSLNMDHNEIEALPENLFKDNENLEELSIGHNKLTIIHSTSFGNPLNFTTLYCHSNNIQAFDKTLIETTTLINLDMTNNSCVDDWILIRDRISASLNQCIENYDSFGIRLSDASTIPQTNIRTTTLSYDSIDSTSDEPVFSKNTNINNKDNLKNIKLISNENSCGKPKSGIQTTIGGTYAPKGAYPWNAAIHTFEKGLICGGTIVSKNKIVTAAHCFKGKHQDPALQLKAGDIFVIIGAHNLSLSYEIGRQSFAVREIIIHTDWNPNIKSFDADIAILKLDDDIIFSYYIQPICLVYSNSNMESITNGIVAGFGKSEDNEVENIARVIKMPIYSYNYCVKSEDHENLMSKRMFCGGYANGTGVCVGDSGSGVYVVYQNTYYLRGIVSASLTGKMYGCNVHEYAVFTNVVNYTTFIES